MAYLMYKYGHSYEQALDQLVSNRSVVALNKGFEAQLRAYGEESCDVYSAHQLLLRKRIANFSHGKLVRARNWFRFHLVSK